MENEIKTEDKCQSCLEEFKFSQELKHEVTSELQSIFFDLLRIEVDRLNLKTTGNIFFYFSSAKGKSAFHVMQISMLLRNLNIKF